jgi:hypothetical protein
MRDQKAKILRGDRVEGFSEMTIPQCMADWYPWRSCRRDLREELETGGAVPSVVELLDVDVVSLLCLFGDRAKKCPTGTCGREKIGG